MGTTNNTFGVAFHLKKAKDHQSGLSSVINKFYCRRNLSPQNS